MTQSPLQSLDLSNRVALVTGASRGIGAATVKLLESYGATVVGLSRSGNGSTRACDVTDWNAIQQAVESVIAEHGQLDILVNNAGTITPQALTWGTPPTDWAAGLQTNVVGVYHGLRAALPHMIAQGSGTVVNISSGAANSALPGWSMYCASKAAAKRLTEVSHRELREAGHTDVHVVGLSPGTVATDMMASIRDADINAVSRLDWSAHIPPEWAAEGVAFLCGDAGAEFAGSDFSIKTPEGRARVGLLLEGAPDA